MNSSHHKIKLNAVLLAMIWCIVFLFQIDFRMDFRISCDFYFFQNESSSHWNSVRMERLTLRLWHCHSDLLFGLRDLINHREQWSEIEANLPFEHSYAFLIFSYENRISKPSFASSNSEKLPKRNQKVARPVKEFLTGKNYEFFFISFRMLRLN